MGGLEALKGLPARHRVAGLAEVVKSAFIADAKLFRKIENVAGSLVDPTHPSWGDVLRASCRIKASIVADDPKETGRRALLNFGHSFGHALESVQRPRLLHGEAVSLGMIAATKLSVDLLTTQVDTLQRLESLLSRLALPLRLRRLDSASLCRAIAHDKKSGGGELRAVLTQGVGSASFGHAVERAAIRRAFQSLHADTR